MDIKPLNGHKRGLLIGCLVFASLVIRGTKQQDTFYFDPAPIDRDVVAGDEVRIQCDVSNRRHILFTWELDRKTLANTSRRFQEDTDLMITRVDRQLDSGAFRCTATNVTTGVSLRSSEARLNILWLDRAAEVQLKQPKEHPGVDLDGELWLKCHCEGNPEPKVDWYHNKLLRLFPNERLRFHKNRMKVIGMKPEDNGIYSCRASNLAGEVTSADNYMLNIEGGSAAHLVAESFTREVLVKQGQSARFDCQYDNAMITEWYLDERRLVNSTGGSSSSSSSTNGGGGVEASKYLSYNNGTLLVNTVQTNDSGIYRCVGISAVSGAPVQTFVSELLIAYLKPLTVESFQPKPPKNNLPIVVAQGQKFEIQCLVPSGLPTPVQRWEYPKHIQFFDVSRITAEHGLLTILDTTPEDSGNYTCIVENLASTRSKAVWVVISKPPSFKQPPLADRVLEGRTAWFNCKYAGTPYPVTTVTWKKDDVPLDLMASRFNLNRYNGTLTIKRVSRFDQGDYTCIVNTTGHPVLTSENAHLYIEKRLKFIGDLDDDDNLELGSDSKIYCVADARTKPTVRWRKEGASELPPHVVDLGGILQLNGVKYEDAGRYTCTAFTTDEHISTTINISVGIQPKIKVKPTNTTAYQGLSTILHCQAVGDPMPRIRWDKNNRDGDYDETRFTVLPNGSLYITQVYLGDIGKYGCTAGNRGGLQREEAYLNVAEQGGTLGVPSSSDSYNMIKTIIIAVCSAVAYLAIVIGLTVYCSIRLVRAKKLRKQEEAENAQAGDKLENGTVATEHTELIDKSKDRDSSCVKSDVDARSHVSGVSSHPSHSTSQSHASSLGSRIDKLNFPRHQLQTLGMLGKGQYGDVFLAKAHYIRDGEPESLVVVKSLLTRDEHHNFEFRREVEMFGKMSHENVVKLLGLCREMEPQFIITEYCDWGDLKQFLWATRKDNSKRNIKLQPLTTAQRVTMCSQVAMGMEHLANNRYLHRDLAARNLLLCSTLDVKISLLGLCRDVYAAEYVPFHQQLIPLRWMAPEAVLEDEFSTKSDVWAFAVTAWEIFAQGDLPLKESTDEEVLRGLKTGQCRLDTAHLTGCPDDMVQLLCKCITDSPKERPSFSDIIVTIGDMTVDSDV